jgi:prolyl-tRNA synthetase
MRQSILFTKTSKHVQGDEPSTNAQLLLRAGYIDKLMAGVYTILPLGQRVLYNLEQIIRRAMESIAGQELTMPALQPKQSWVTTGRWDTMQDILYTLRDEAGHEYTLGPTHEEIVTPVVGKFIQSYRDLPRSVFQFQVKFRKELRPKSGLLRGREFIMKDMYSFHATQADLDNYYERVSAAYRQVFADVGIGDATYLTFASGGAFSKYSHEFQTVTPAGEDVIYICQSCRLAVNREIKPETAHCPGCGQVNFTEHKAIEVGNIFQLGTKFSQPFGLQYLDAAGQTQPVIMGCYGMGLGRIMGTIVEVHHDDKGIIWPESVSPYKLHLINLNKDSVQADEIYDLLQKAGISVLYDDREISAGNKFADADLLGITHRLVTSQKTGSAVEYRRRGASQAAHVSVEQIIQQHGN